MSSHRADKRRAFRAERQPSDSVPARRRAARSRKRVRKPAVVSLVGAAVILSAVGAVAFGQSVTDQDHQAGAPTSVQLGAYVAASSVGDPPVMDLQSRDTTQVSRAGDRVAPVSRQVDQAAAQRRAEAAQRSVKARRDKLRDATYQAQTYADKLQQQREERRADRRAQRREQRQEQREEQRQEQRQEQLATGWVLPTSNFAVSTLFGVSGPYWSSGYHTGLDLAAPYGTPVVAVTGATVVQAGDDGAYGNQVRIQLDNGDQVWYNHLSSIEVTTGQAVTTGQEIGRVGDTGNSYGYHLHLEYRLASDLDSGVDPMPYLLEHGLAL